MVTITNGTIDWELSCERYALIGGAPPSGWTVKANTCANYARQLNAPFASFGVGGGDGTVRSVALAADEDIFEVSGSPVTDIGTLILALKEQGAGLVFAGPVTGADGVPTFRVLELSDLPDGAVTGDGAENELAYWDTNETISHISKSYILPDEARFTDFVLKIRTALSGVDFHIFSDADGGKLQTFGSMPLFINPLGNAIKMPQLAGGTERVMFIATDGTIFGDALIAADIPNLPASIITSGVLPVVRGGTGLSALGTALQYLRTNAGATAMEWATLTAITGTLVAPRIPYASGAGTLTDTADLQWDNTAKGVRAGAGAGAVVGTYTAYPLNGNGFYAFASVSGAVYGTLENFWNASNAGNAYWIIKVGGASAGDPFIMFVIASATTWSAGVDNSDNDIFKIGPYQNPGNGVLGLQILPTGEVGISGAPNTALSMLFALSKPLGIPSGTDATRALSNTYGSVHYNATSQRVEVIGASKGYYQTIASYVAITATAGAASGTGATITPQNATELHGVLSLVTGTGTSAGALFTINFNAMVTPTIVLFGRNAAGAAQLTNVYVSTQTTTSLTISCAAALAASTTYQWSYRIDG